MSPKMFPASLGWLSSTTNDLQPDWKLDFCNSTCVPDLLMRLSGWLERVLTLVREVETQLGDGHLSAKPHHLPEYLLRWKMTEFFFFFF